MLREVMPLLLVNDLEETLCFYTEVLGFQLCWKDGDTASVEQGHARLMFSTGENLGCEPSLSGTLYFYPEDVRSTWERVSSKAAVEWPLQKMDYGTVEFGIRDPNGYILAFAEVS